MVNKWVDYDIPLEKIFKLGPLECVTSNFINALILWGKNYKLFLLNYWTVDYYHQLFLGSRNLNLCLIPYLYGIKINIQKGMLQDINNLLNQNHMAIVLCKASQLAYFPIRYLTHENRGLGHTFLIYGYNSNDQTYKIIDAMANFSGSISMKQLEDLVDADGNLSYYPLIYSDHTEPKIEDIFVKATTYNYTLFTQKVFNYGQKSFLSFYKAILDSFNWDKTARNQWIDQNTLTITSLINNRLTIWNYIKELKLLNPEEESLIGEKMDNLIKQWKSLIFILTKLKKTIDDNLCDSLKNKLELLKELEEAVLLIMRKVGQRIKKEEPVVPLEISG
jgi:hypothetical protein